MSKKLILVLALWVVFAAACFSADGRSVYSIKHIDREIDIENSFDDPLWQQAQPAGFYAAGSKNAPLNSAEARLLWSDKYLYVRYKAFDKDIFSYYTQRDSATCTEDVLELFLKTDPKGEAYYNFEINALNTVYDAYQPKRSFAGGDHRWMQWDCKGLRSAVYIKGTLNDPKDRDEYWILQAAVPFEELEIPGRAVPSAGDTWSFNLGRINFSVYLPDTGKELSTCCYIAAKPVSFHASEYWNTLKFIK